MIVWKTKDIQVGIVYFKKDKTFGFRPHKDNLAKFKKKLKIITNRTNGKSRGYVKLKLRQVGQGWI